MKKTYLIVYGQEIQMFEDLEAFFENACDCLYYGEGRKGWFEEAERYMSHADAQLVWHAAFDFMGNEHQPDLDELENIKVSDDVWSGDVKLKTKSPSTRALMDWLTENKFPSLNKNYVYTSDMEYAGIISDFVPEAAILDSLDEGCEYNGMKRWKLIGASWLIKTPGNRYYYFSI